MTKQDMGLDVGLIGQAFRDARVAAGKRQDEFGDQPGISRFEAGRKSPNLSAFVSWCAIGGFNPAAILATASAKSRSALVPRRRGYRVTMQSGEVRWFLACGASISNGRLVLWTPGAGADPDPENGVLVAAAVDLADVAEWVEVPASDVPWEGSDG